MNPRFATLWVTLQLTYLSIMALGAFVAWLVLKRVNMINRKMDAWQDHTSRDPSRPESS